MAIALLLIAYGLLILRSLSPTALTIKSRLLTDPFLQLPTQDTVQVVWFTEFAGSNHVVEYGNRLEQRIAATTTKLDRVREDQQSHVGEQTEAGQIYSAPTYREIWRHEATVTGLTSNARVPYRVKSTDDQGTVIRSDRFTLAPAPTAGMALKILLTSDHQLKPLTPANLQKVVETIGTVDAVFLAGDLVDIPDRASEWFDDNRGNAFFASLQGRAAYDLEREGTTVRYQGGALIQSAPLFPALGNHEVMGRFSMEQPLGEQFNDPIPRQVANQWYLQQAQQINPASDPQIEQDWLKNNSFNSDTYEQIFSLPADSPGEEKYYAVSFGDVRLISLYVANIWRNPSLDSGARGRYREKDGDLNDSTRWGYGQHIFESIAPGSPQYEWLQAELSKPEFQQAKYKIVMFHYPPHSVGDNIVPAYTDPVQIVDRFPEGQIKAVRYEYPLAADYLIRDVMPLLEEAGVQLVFYGHSHLWNRFVSPSGMHFLETSNVGNTYGAYTYTNQQRRPIPIGFSETYAAMGDPNGLSPVVPTISPLLDENGQPQPYIASNDITIFSILDTGAGIVTSYRFDARLPESATIKFDEFQLR
ncbi:MAG: metallophosphoesterase [Elainellaceae cyanobacterium]